MTDQYEWETVEIPQGSFIGWGSKPGQHVTGKVLAYNPSGGTDYNGDTCPLLTVELVDKAASFNKAGERIDYPAGDLVNVTCGQAGLKAGIQAANPSAGDLVKITMAGTTTTNKGNEMKQFDLKIARGAGQAQTPGHSAPAAADAEPPF